MSGYWQNFDLTQGINILRLICGLFFIPHIYAKFFVPEALGFFKAAKFIRRRFICMSPASSRSSSQPDLSSRFSRFMPACSASSTC